MIARGARRAVTLSAAAVLGGSVLTAPGVAQAFGCGPSYLISNVKQTADITLAGGNGSTESGYAPATLSLTQSLSHSNEYSISPSLSSGTVSSAVGFSVTNTYGTTAGYAYVAKGSGLYTIYADNVFHKKVFDVDQEVCGQNTKVGTGHALEWFKFTYGWRKGN